MRQVLNFKNTVNLTELRSQIQSGDEENLYEAPEEIAYLIYKDHMSLINSFNSE